MVEEALPVTTVGTDRVSVAVTTIDFVVTLKEMIPSGGVLSILTITVCKFSILPALSFEKYRIV